MIPTNTLLTAKQIIDLGIVSPNNDDAVRPTTIDATIGHIITKKGICKEQCMNIPPRGIAWIMSQELYKLPNNITGITTLRTTWTRKGILTLTVGIVDPGYQGYLGTAVINFGKNDFPITKGDTFFRTTFFQHDEVQGIDRCEDEQAYLNSVLQDSAAFSDNFLTIDTLAEDLIPKIFGFPRWGVILTAIGLVLAVFALVLPPAIGLNYELAQKNASVYALEKEVVSLETAITELRSDLSRLETTLEQVNSRAQAPDTIDPEQN